MRQDCSPRSASSSRQESEIFPTKLTRLLLVCPVGLPLSTWSTDLPCSHTRERRAHAPDGLARDIWERDVVAMMGSCSEDLGFEQDLRLARWQERRSHTLDFRD